MSPRERGRKGLMDPIIFEAFNPEISNDDVIQLEKIWFGQENEQKQEEKTSSTTKTTPTTTLIWGKQAMTRDLFQPLKF